MELGISIEYKEQKKPNGLAEAFLIGEEFIDNSPVALMLGDNILYGNGITANLDNAVKNVKDGACVFGYHVSNPSEFGIAEINSELKCISLEEKPKNPKSNIAVIGLYFYDKNVVKYAKQLKPSTRGELEITDINKKYLDEGKLSINILSRGFAWFDTGTSDNILDASNFVASVEKRQNLKIACLEEISFRMNYISKEKLLKLSKKSYKSSYCKYLKDIANNLY